MPLDHKLKLLEFCNKWHQYRVMQEELEQMRTKGDVPGVTDLLRRIVALRQDIDDQLAPILNTITAEQKADNLKRPVISMKPIKKGRK